MGRVVLMASEIVAGPSEFMTFSGRLVDLLKPEPSDVLLDDVAHHLSMVCRFGGACPEHYSIASHCVLVSKILQMDYPDDRELQFAGLLHDASEAYVGDVVSPLKHRLPGYAPVEDRWMRAIGEAFAVDYKMFDDPRVHRADDQAFGSEWRDLFPRRPPLRGAVMSPVRVKAEPSVVAKVGFLARFGELRRG